MKETIGFWKELNDKVFLYKFKFRLGMDFREEMYFFYVYVVDVFVIFGILIYVMLMKIFIGVRLNFLLVFLFYVLLGF